MLAKRHRFSGRSEISKLFAKDVSVQFLRSGNLSARVVRTSASTLPSQFVVSVSKKVGKAVLRNSLRRLIYREVATFLTTQPELSDSGLRMLFSVQLPQHLGRNERSRSSIGLATRSQLAGDAQALLAQLV